MIGQISVTVFLLLCVFVFALFAAFVGMVWKAKKASELRTIARERLGIVPVKTSYIDEPESFDDSPPESLSQFIRRTEREEKAS